MAAGVFGYLGYDMVRLMEELPPANPDPIGMPDAVMMRPTIVVVFDAVKRRDHGGDAGAAGEKRRCQRRARARGRAARRRSSPASNGRSTWRQPISMPARSMCAAQSNTTPAEYKAMVRSAKDYIAAGDVFQVVLAQRF